MPKVRQFHGLLLIYQQAELANHNTQKHTGLKSAIFNKNTSKLQFKRP